MKELLESFSLTSSNFTYCDGIKYLKHNIKFEGKFYAENYCQEDYIFRERERNLVALCY